MNSIVARKYARLSLEGLSVGDAFGQRYWGGGHADVQHRRFFPPPWTFTDDTVMAIGITEMLEAAGDIQQETLALGHFEEALWTTVSRLGDCDTTCAIVGGIVVLSTGREGIPSAWLAAREPLDDWIAFRSVAT